MKCGRDAAKDAISRNISKREMNQGARRSWSATTDPSEEGSDSWQLYII